MTVDTTVAIEMATFRLREAVARKRDETWEYVLLCVKQNAEARSCWSCLAEPGEEHDHWCSEVPR